MQHAVDVVVDVEVGAQGRPGEAGGAAVVRPEDEDEGDEGGEGDDDVHGRKSARTLIPPPVADLSVSHRFPAKFVARMVRMLRTIAVVVQEPVAAFELGVLCEVFGIDRTDDGVPAFDFRVCAVAARARSSRSTSGIGIVATHGLDAARDADLVAVPAGSVDGPFEPEILEVLRETVDRGGRVLSVCSGAFTLAAAGLLDGRACTTHWRYAARLAEVCPGADVDLDVLYVEDGPIITSAGTAAGIDACLHLVRTELGSEVATRIARRMVVPPHRAGGQRQYVETPVPEQPCDSLQDVLDCACSSTSTGTTPSPRSRGGRRCRSAPSRGGSAPRSARRRTSGSPRSGCSARGTCSRRPTSTSSASPARAVSRRRPSCAATSSGRSALPPAAVPQDLRRHPARLTASPRMRLSSSSRAPIFDHEHLDVRPVLERS